DPRILFRHAGRYCSRILRFPLYWRPGGGRPDAEREAIRVSIMIQSLSKDMLFLFLPMPELSVLLPYLHRDDRYYRAVQSVLNQQFRDFELLLIDNTTMLPEADRELSDPRIRFVGAATRGIAFALNKGLKVARGKFIGRMDADDLA